MPPRVQTGRVSNTLLPYLTSTSSSTSSLPSSSSQCLRQFSATTASQTKLRRQMFEWLSTAGAGLKNHVPGETNYLSRLKQGGQGDSNRPFPNNPNFVSESILSEDLREEIYKRVTSKKQSLRAVSVELGIDMKRIAAVVRLVELEKRQRSQGKPLALPYARAVHEMVPVTPLADKGERQPYHESINDLPAHPLTGSQIFYPVPESRSFNRVEAGRVFSGAPALTHEETAEIKHPYDLAQKVIENPKTIGWVGKGEKARQILQPADVRIPHPHMIGLERDRIENPNERHTVHLRHTERLARQESLEQEARQRAQDRREASQQTVSPAESRFDYRIQEATFTKETTGANGRAPWAVGRRYGVPHNDRTRGTVKIPTRVDA